MKITKELIRQRVCLECYSGLPKSKLRSYSVLLHKATNTGLLIGENITVSLDYDMAVAASFYSWVEHEGTLATFAYIKPQRGTTRLLSHNIAKHVPIHELMFGLMSDHVQSYVANTNLTGSVIDLRSNHVSFTITNVNGDNTIIGSSTEPMIDINDIKTKALPITAGHLSDHLQAPYVVTPYTVATTIKTKPTAKCVESVQAVTTKPVDKTAELHEQLLAFGNPEYKTYIDFVTNEVGEEITPEVISRATTGVFAFCTNPKLKLVVNTRTRAFMKALDDCLALSQDPVADLNKAATFLRSLNG